MTPEQFEKGKSITSSIYELTSLIRHSEKQGIYIRPGFSINNCLEQIPIPVSKHVKDVISALVVADLKTQLASLQKEFEEL